MLSVSSLVFSAVLVAGGVRAAADLAFPPGFKFGVASAAYQVEGAWNVSDKGESMWDRFTHARPFPVVGSSTGDVACDSYHRWREDVSMLRDLAVHFYRFSISWPRLLPTGFAEHISKDGSKYYNELIDGLLEAGVEPMVTLYHWDLPQRLQDLGGWANPLIAEWFAEYARVVFSLYGDRVTTWVTVNEPWLMCDVAYTGVFAPGVSSEVGSHLCTKHVLLAHARAYRLYHREFRDKYHGVVSLANHDTWFEAANDTDKAVTELVRHYQEGRYAHPIFSAEGGWPPAVERAVAEYSRREGYPGSLLPAFTPHEILLVKGTADFYALNFYNSREVASAGPDEALQPWPLHDLPLFHARLQVPARWPALMGIWADYPAGLRKQLVWLKRTYGDIPILITENGCATSSTTTSTTSSTTSSDSGLRDVERVQYYRNYLEQVLLAIKEDGVNVTGYTACTLMDNFEWASGYTTKFGLYEVDFSSENRTRTPRLSAQYYASVVRAHSLDVPTHFPRTVSRAGDAPASKGSNSYLMLGGILLVVVVALAAALLGCWVRRRRRAHCKGEYAAVKGRPNQDGPSQGTDGTNDHHANI